MFQLLNTTVTYNDECRICPSSHSLEVSRDQGPIVILGKPEYYCITHKCILSFCISHILNFKYHIHKNKKNCLTKHFKKARRKFAMKRLQLKKKNIRLYFIITSKIYLKVLKFDNDYYTSLRITSS